MTQDEYFEQAKALWQKMPTTVISATPRFENVINLRADMDTLSVQYTTTNRPEEDPEYQLVLLCRQWQYTQFLSHSPIPLSDSEPQRLGQQLERYASMIPVDSVCSVVKFCNVYAPLPGVQTGVQITDLPGVDSTNTKMDELTMATVRKLDLLLFVKRTQEQPQLQMKEMAIFRKIGSSAADTAGGASTSQGDYSRVVVCFTCQDDDWSTSIRGVTPLTAESAVNDLHVKAPSISMDRVHFLGGTRKYGEMSASDPTFARVQFSCQELTKLLQGTAQVTPDNLDGFDRFNRCINALLNSGLGELDRQELLSLQSEERRVLQQSQALLAQLDGYPLLRPADETPNVLGGFLVYGNGDTIGMLAAINKAILKHLPVNEQAPILFQRGKEASKDENAFPTLLYQPPAGTSADQAKLDAELIEDTKKRLLSMTTNVDDAERVGQLFDAEINRLAPYQMLTFEKLEGVYRALLLRRMDPLLKEIAEFERRNLVTTLDTILLAVLRLEYRGGKLLNIFRGDDAQQQPEDIRKMLLQFKKKVFEEASLGLHKRISGLVNCLKGVLQRTHENDAAGGHKPIAPRYKLDGQNDAKVDYYNMICMPPDSLHCEHNPYHSAARAETALQPLRATLESAKGAKKAREEAINHKPFFSRPKYSDDHKWVECQDALTKAEQALEWRSLELSEAKTRLNYLRSLFVVPFEVSEDDVLQCPFTVQSSSYQLAELRDSVLAKKPMLFVDGVRDGLPDGEERALLLAIFRKRADAALSHIAELLVVQINKSRALMEAREFVVNRLWSLFTDDTNRTTLGQYLLFYYKQLWPTHFADTQDRVALIAGFKQAKEAIKESQAGVQ